MAAMWRLETQERALSCNNQSDRQEIFVIFVSTSSAAQALADNCFCVSLLVSQIEQQPSGERDVSYNHRFPTPQLTGFDYNKGRGGKPCCAKA
jgi:hypothetical protein